jgi:ketosteroid isomerase-like protein
MRSLFPLLLVLACAAVALAQTRAHENMDSGLIQQLEASWLNAERTTDAALLDQVMADDFVGIGVNGETPGKAQLLKNWRSQAGQGPPYTGETSGMRVFVLGEVAVATYTKTYIAKENRNVAHEDVTDVFTRQHGSWKMRLSRFSPH